MRAATATDPGKIPVANLLRMVFYARHLLEELEDSEVARADGAAFEDILQEMLSGAADRLRLRGIERGYWPNKEHTARPRGRVLLAESIASCSIPAKRLSCAFDDFGVDTPHNRMLKACAQALARCGESPERQDRLRALARDMRDVSNVVLSQTFLRTLPRSPATRRYRVVRFIARLIVEAGQPDERLGEEWARRLVQDEVKMRKVFERFVRRYGRAHAPRGTSVGQTRLRWSAAEQPHVGGLETDVTIKHDGAVRVVECKYMRSATTLDHRGKRMFHPEHLRQIYAYLARTHDTPPAPKRVDGVLLYPAVDEATEQIIDLGEFAVRVVRLPLSAPWSALTARLRQLLFEDRAAP
jgi:5-methylcytosine-specific restriction enzyme subunit McrC